MDIDKQITEAEEKIEKLKVLKAKQEELKQLETELDITDKEPSKKISKVQKIKPIRISPRARKVAISLLICSMLLTVSFLFTTRVVAADPVVVYADPDDDGLFADTNDGDGVNWVINVSDADTDIQEVELWANSSGTWAVFYDSGALGGVAYHNTSGQNGNWTGSWTKYWWNISVNDGTWHNTTYSFSTAYQWGDPQMAVLDDVITYDNAVILKNATGDYYLFYENGAIDVKTSDTGVDWSLEPKSADIGAGQYLSSCFTYNNLPYCLYYWNSYLYYGYWDGSSWNTGSTEILQFATNTIGIYADCVYYNGVWNIVAGFAPAGLNIDLRYYTGTFPSSWTFLSTFETNTQYLETYYSSDWYPSLAVLDGILHLIYKNGGCNLDWWTYDGASWTNKGAVGGDSLNLGGGTSSSYQYYGCSMVKDPVNNQLVCIYINTSGNLMYRVTDNLTSWSDPYLILSKGSYDIRYPHVEYIDHRLVITFSYNLRGNYNIYTMSSPGYSGRISGLNYTLNRIQWPDASPGDTHVNSTVFSLKNINNRSIKTITWHFEDIGEIANASNIEMWTNMSGAWTSIGTTGADGNIATLDISGLMAGGAEWVPGQTIYWKAEILAVGAVSEDIHTTDEDIYYKITF